MRVSPSSNHKRTTEILIRGSDVISQYPNFSLVGRDQELKDLYGILMKMKKNNIIITGRGGVGTSSIVLGIQASKENLDTPVEIVGKRLFWLSTDSLFESGNSTIINDAFNSIRKTLHHTSQSVVVIEDTVDFIRSSQHLGCMNLINGLMGDLKTSKYQAIFEIKDENIGEVLKCDGDILEFCSLYEVKEPSNENLYKIIEKSAKELEDFHNIKITKKAFETAILLTDRYKLSELRAQPDSSYTLIDNTFTEFCIELHQHNNKNSNEASSEWKKLQKEIRLTYRDISDGEAEIRKLENELELIIKNKNNNLDSLKESSDSQSENTTLSFKKMFSNSTIEDDEIRSIKAKIYSLEKALLESSSKYKEKIAHIYDSLEINDSHILKTFSSISGIPVDKLSENEKEVLKNLEQTLAKSVVGQDEPVQEVSKAVKRARLGLKMPNKPSGSFMFLGPSGVGKTELAKALSSSLDVPLLRFDMSEYMEKHAVAKLIGAPPGYEGFENGGILTNSVRRNPYSVILFDEIEKAHPDVFNIMLQLLDDARLTDSRGLTASFKDTIVLMTTNIGTTHFLNEEITFEESKNLALKDLKETYRPEFLGRFGGNIYCFKRLNDDVLFKIAKKDISRINHLLQDKSLELNIEDNDLKEIIKESYLSREGARSIIGYIDRNITSQIADFVLNSNDPKGQINVRFEKENKKVLMQKNI